MQSLTRGWKQSATPLLTSLAIGVCAVILANALRPQVASAQVVDRPSDERPSLESLEPPDGPPRVPLEVDPAPPPPPRGPLAAGLRVFVSEVQVVGSTVFSRRDFLPITQPFENRSVSSSDLQDLTNAITALYTAAGYISSGATIPDQNLAGGVLRVEIVESRLVDVVTQGNRWHRADYLRRRILAAVAMPIRVQDVEEQLQLLLQDRDIVRVAGKLQPGPRRGETVLALTLEERAPFGVRGTVANDNSPGIGPVRGRLYVEDRNTFGFSDPLEGRFDFAEGLLAQEVRYAFPVTPWETLLRARFRHTQSEIVQSDFASADIEAEAWTGTIGLYHPIIRTPSTRLSLGLVAERRRTRITLAGDDFEFVPGPDRFGRSDVTVVRLVAEGSWRSRDDVVAARSLLSFGIDVLGATSNSGRTPDGRSVIWLGQVQWAHRLPAWLLESQVIVRADAQLTNNALLSLERIAVGGVRTVRGYQENLLVRDEAVILSGELRIPIVKTRFGTLQLAPFFDWGTAWNKNRDAQGRNVATTLRSVGLGLRYSWADHISAYAYWGGALQKGPNTGGNIQEDGFHLGIQIRAF